MSNEQERPHVDPTKPAVPNPGATKPSKSATSKSALPPAPPPRPDDVDALETQVPSGEVGVRNQPGEILAGESGGTSKSEDTTRAAGYATDLTKANEPPPGPPVAKSPENFAGPESETVPPTPSRPPVLPAAPKPARPASDSRRPAPPRPNKP